MGGEPKNEIDKKYFAYQLETKFNIEKESARGSTIKTITKEEFTKFKIPIPPLTIQKEIIKILDNFTQLEAELEAELEARKKQYEHYRETLLSFDDGVEFRTLGEVATFKYGFTAKAANAGDFRFIRITDITEGGKLSLCDAKYIVATENISDFLVQQGDILMARTGATFGKTLLITNDISAIYASFLIRIKMDETKILPSYYWHFAQSASYWIQANSLVSQGGQPQFNANVLRNICLPIPPLPEQKRIVAILDKFDALVSDISVGLPAEISARKKQYEYYRNQLLTFKPLVEHNAR